MLPFPVLSPGIPSLAAALMLFGALNGTLDVAMNAQAVRVEQLHGRPIMSSLHALFSLGAVVGATATGLTMSLGDRPLLATALVTAAAVVVSARRLVSSAPSVRAMPFTVSMPRGALIGLGALAFLGLLAEGAMVDWSAVYLRDEVRTAPMLAAAGFAVFSLAMAFGRFTGDHLVRRVGPERVLRVSAAEEAIGLALALSVRRPSVALIGFALVGLGISNVIPILFSAAGRVRGVHPGTALAAVATTGYLGFLAGPPAIGLVAEAAGLTVGLGIVAVACVLIAAGAAVALGDRDADDRRFVIEGVTAVGSQRA
jgi:predicted MFS family arabinose efflux permease